VFYVVKAVDVIRVVVEMWYWSSGREADKVVGR
jgi:hypothetical protein